MNMLDYLDKNKEWLFSGLGVAILGYIGTQLWHRIRPNPRERAILVVPVADGTAEKTRRVETTHDSARAKISRITDITIAEIAEALEKAPPLQKDDIAKHYKGLNVQWETQLFGAERHGKDDVELTLDFGSGSSHLVFCKVRLSEYGELGVLPKGAPITVMGRIARVHGKSASLEDVRLFFHHPKDEHRA